VIPGDAIEHYYHVLNVIGARLRANPLSMVSVVGCSDNGANDNAVPRIGDQRAETVQDYLVRIWGIDPQRIRVSGRGLPEIPSSTSVPEGVAENRRVEILSTDWEIMKPLSFETRELRVDPDTLFMGMRFTLDGVLTRWKLPVYAGGKLWREFTDTTGPDVEVCWDLRGPNGEFPRSSLRYEWSVEDSSGEETVVHRAALPVKLLTVERKKVENLADMEIERFNLILFEFNKADLGSRNERILQLVVPGIKPESNVTVAGYTDVIGEERANQLLSEQRARAVYGRLRDIGTPCRSMESIGYGEALRLFSNLLPEGRFYNRTVQITIKTPVRPE
jgi:outer membrane protein OmpA-like peptidoglycan-associated protein